MSKKVTLIENDFMNYIERNIVKLKDVLITSFVYPKIKKLYIFKDSGTLESRYRNNVALENFCKRWLYNQDAFHHLRKGQDVVPLKNGSDGTLLNGYQTSN